jgi:hypothetical protein
VAYRPVSRQRPRNNSLCHATNFDKQEYTAAVRERLGKHVPASPTTHAIIEELSEMMFSAQSVPRCYYRDCLEQRVQCSVDSQAVKRKKTRRLV